LPFPAACLSFQFILPVRKLDLARIHKEKDLIPMSSLPKIRFIPLLVVAVLCATSAWTQEIPTTQPIPPAAEGSGPKVVGNISSHLGPKVSEDWTTPSLKGSDLEIYPPLLGEIDDSQPSFTREITQVQWRPGDPIHLYIIKPAGVKNPPVILYLFSYPFETDRYLDNDYCKFLVKDGYAAIGFASALTSTRYHDRPMKKWLVSELQESLATSAHDVQMILNFLATRGDMDMDRVGMFGDGSGASIAILAAAVDPRIKTLDLLNPWSDWPDWIAKSTRIPENERADYLKPEFLAAVAPLDPVKWLPELKTQKVRIQDVATVTVTPTEARQKIESAAPSSVQIVRYDDAKAFLAAASGGKGFDWIKEQLKSSTGWQYSATGNSPTHETVR
jgi:hypothetical protein